MELTFFDFSVFGIIAFFALIGLVRGFIKEVFSIVNWLIAGIVTVYLRPIISSLILLKIDIPILADLISNSFLFTATLILISILTSNLAKGIGSIFPAIINILFGFLFGTLKGYILSAFIFSIILNVYSGSQEEPMWLAESISYQPISIGSNLIDPFTQSLFGSLTGMELSKDEDEDESKNEINNLIEKIDEKESEDNWKYIKGSDIKEDKIENTNKGYKEDQIKKMNRLMDTINN